MKHIKEFSHPEMDKTEVFFTNGELSWFVNLQFESKRLGKISYDGNGNRLTIKNWYPIFLKKIELRRIDKTLTEIRKSFRKKYPAPTISSENPNDHLS